MSFISLNSGAGAQSAAESNKDNQWGDTGFITNIPQTQSLWSDLEIFSSQPGQANGPVRAGTPRPRESVFPYEIASDSWSHQPFSLDQWLVDEQLVDEQLVDEQLSDGKQDNYLMCFDQDHALACESSSGNLHESERELQVQDLQQSLILDRWYAQTHGTMRFVSAS
jgi:hypothetical protein